MSIPASQATPSLVRSNGRTSAPIFIFGAPRSGTTMCRLMLNAHSRLAVPFETNCLPKYVVQSHRYGNLGVDANARRLIQDLQSESFVQRSELGKISWAEIRARYTDRSLGGLVDALYGAYAQREGKVRWGDKSPASGLYIDTLKHLFPDAYFLHVIRDGRDLALSRMNTWKVKSLLKVAHDWAAVVSLGRRSGSLVGGQYYELRYERLVTDTESELRKVCEWLNEPFDPRMLNYHEHAVEHMPEDSLRHHQTSIRAPKRSKVQRWRTKMSLGDRAVFQRVASRLLQDLGYELDDEQTLRFRIACRVAEIKYALRGQTTFASPLVRI